MAEWKSKAQLEQEEMERIGRRISEEIKQNVARLVESWEASGYPGFSACEKAIGDLVRATSTHQGLTTASMKIGVLTFARKPFMEPIEKTLRQRQRDQEKQQAEAFKIASQGRAVVSEGWFKSSSRLGEISRVKEPDERERILTCIDCKYASPDYDENFEGGYFCKWAEPTDEERATETYQRIKKNLEDEQAYEQRQQEIIEERRQADLKAIRAEGREPTFLEEFFAGTSDN